MPIGCTVVLLVVIAALWPIIFSILAPGTLPPATLVGNSTGDCESKRLVKMNHPI